MVLVTKVTLKIIIFMVKVNLLGKTEINTLEVWNLTYYMVKVSLQINQMGNHKLVNGKKVWLLAEKN